MPQSTQKLPCNKQCKSILLFWLMSFSWDRVFVTFDIWNLYIWHAILVFRVFLIFLQQESVFGLINHSEYIFSPCKRILTPALCVFWSGTGLIKSITGEISSDLYGLSGCDILNLTFCRLDFHQLLIKIS